MKVPTSEQLRKAMAEVKKSADGLWNEGPTPLFPPRPFLVAGWVMSLSHFDGTQEAPRRKHFSFRWSGESRRPSASDRARVMEMLRLLMPETARDITREARRRGGAAVIAEHWVWKSEFDSESRELAN